MADSGRKPRFRSVRARLLMIALLPMLVVMPVFLGLVMANWSERFDRLLIAKVNGELTIAHQYMTGLLERSGEQVQALGESAAFAKVDLQNPAALQAFLADRRKALKLDFLYFTGAGKSARWPVIRQALAGQRGSVIDIFSQKQLSAISPKLAGQARIALVPTKAATPTNRTEENRGMVVHTASPARGGALVGGVLLNRNLDFIDTINDLVYPAASLTEGSRGTATLFLEDVRISTNVRLFENVRALGTRVSAIVRERVLGLGQVWLDRAFVVNDWYISAYEPIIDSYGKRVGMLYVGFLDTPFRAAKMRTIWMVVAGFLLVILLSVPIFLRWARGIINPLEKVVDTISKVESGDLGARTGVTGGQDEITRVAAHLDGLLEQVQERDQRLRGWNEELNQRVEKRTRELSETNRRLEATTKQLVVSEKLAAIGEITAGIAHEINNPIAVIQGNLDVIWQEIGEQAKDLDTEFALIYEQVHSINILVNKLLQFARPEEYAGVVDYHIPNEVIEDCLPLVQHLMTKTDIALELELHADRAVAMNRTELQQVLINLIVNAIHAMPKGGELRLCTHNQNDNDISGVLIEVADTGSGMPPEVLKSVFDPFFTTKQAEGTGLGLSISQKLITRAGGHISACSDVGIGTRFSIWLPAADTP